MINNALKKKIDAFKTADLLKAADIYPFFRPLQSDQDTEVIIGSKRILMFGSNSYLGLTNHPLVKEAAKKAMDAGMRSCAVLVNGPGAGRESAVRAIAATGIKVTLVRDVTPVPHNGCRPPKRRRV